MAKVYKNEYIIHDDYCVIKITSDKYGVFDVKIDIDSIEDCRKYHWSIHRSTKGENNNVYFYATNHKIGLLHRYLADAPKGMVVDHINGVESDNRKENLKICENKENIRKQKKKLSNTSGYTGVCWNKVVEKWMSYIMVDYKFKNLGYFNNKEEAYERRLLAEKEYFGKFQPIK